MNNEIKDRIKREILCSEFLTRSRKGGEDKYICPFCGSGTGDHETGALHYYRETNTWKCYSCNEYGDVLDLYEKIHGIDFPSAIKELSEKIGIYTGNIPSSYGATVPEGKETEIPSSLTQTTVEEGKKSLDFTDYYKECAARMQSEVGSPAREYLESRGLSIREGNPFWLGFDPKADPAYDPEKGVHHYCPRLIIPIDKGFYLARRIDNGKEFKALYPRDGEAAIFNMKALTNSTVIFVTEAALDALSVIDTGYPAIATNSTSNVPKLIDKLRLNPPTDKIFVLAFDKDAAGYRAAEQMIRELSTLDITYLLAPDSLYNGCKDMNEALCKDREAFIAACADTEKQAKKKKEKMDALKHDPFNSYYRQDMYWESIQAFRESETPTGIKLLDDALGGGFFEGIYLLAGVPASGKTAFALQISDNIAAGGRKVLFFALEMRFRNLMARLMSLHRNAQLVLDGGEVKSSVRIMKTITYDEVTRFYEEHKELLQNLSLSDDLKFRDIDELKKNIENYINSHPNDKKPLIVIDYMQLLKAKGQGSRYDELSYILGVLMGLRNKYGLTIFILSSMSRENYHLPAGVAAVKETGDAEYAAEAIFVLSLKAVNLGVLGGDKTNEKAEARKKIKEFNAHNPREVQLTCTKHRNGKAFFDIDFSYYTNADYFYSDGEKMAEQTSLELKGHDYNPSAVDSFVDKPNAGADEESDIPF